MNLTSAAVEQLESHMPKIVDARTHGIIDYCHAAFFLGMALLWRKREPRAAIAALLTGGFILVESMLTDYPLGVKKVIPFETHGRMDAGFAGASFMVPEIFGFQGTAASKVFTGNGFAETAVVGMTDWHNGHAQHEEHDGRLTIAS